MPETPIHKEELTSFDADVLKVPAGISLDHINVVILIADSKGHIIYANQAVKNIYLLDPKEVLGDGWWNITSENQEEAVKRKGDVVLFAEGKLDSDQFALFERAFTRNDNVTIWTQWTLTRTADNRVIGIAQDITEKKVLAQQLTLKVKENELLLQEVYHRVKNNLQIILSLLKFEFEHIQDEQTLKALKKTNSRIYSMSLIHYELYNQDVVAEAAFENYINKLVKKVAKLYSEDKTIKINTDITCKELNPELTINIGLILVELVSNSIRHGFRNKKEGHIEICFDHNNEVTENVISVKDNGIGFGQSIDPYEANTLGFEIVTSLCKQIEGHFTILKEANHTLAIIRF